MAMFGDAYIRTARVTPAVLVVVPALAFLLYLPQIPALGAVLPALGVVGVVPVAAEVVRGRGKQVEQRLVDTWGGLPTTRALRLRDGEGADLRTARRAAVEQLSRGRLPSAREEAADPEQADSRYVAAVKTVLARLRDTPEGTLLQAENVSFGFRRNLRGVREIALVVLLLAALLNLAVALLSAMYLPGALVLVVHLLSACFWLALVRDTWVRRQADTYSQQFFAATAARAASTRR